jgi:hypothetical protein
MLRASPAAGRTRPPITASACRQALINFGRERDRRGAGTAGWQSAERYRGDVKSPEAAQAPGGAVMNAVKDHRRHRRWAVASVAQQ